MTAQTIVERLLLEANTSEDMHPGDSDIETMREAAGVITDLLAALIVCKHGAEYTDELGDIINAAIAKASP